MATDPSPASATLNFADVESLQDLATFVTRAKSLDSAGAIRLQADGEVLAGWVCVLPGRGVLGSGVVLGLRVMPLHGDHHLDTTVPLAAVSDRLAYRERGGDVGTSVAVPPAPASVTWTALTPPRGGWNEVGAVAADVLETAAREGIAEVAQGTPEGGAGGHAVTALRERVWGQPVQQAAEGAKAPADVTAGTAFAAYTLGFLGRHRDPARVFRSGPWTRVTLPAGHVLTR